MTRDQPPASPHPQDPPLGLSPEELGLSAIGDQWKRLSTSNDISQADLHALHAIASASSRQYKFPGRLEAHFQLYVRLSARAARMLLLLTTLLLFATAILWVPPTIGGAQALDGKVLLIELGLMVPLFAYTSFRQWRYAASDATEWLMIVAFLLESLVVQYLCRYSDRAGFPIDPHMNVLIPLSVVALARLRVLRAVLFTAAFFVLQAFAARWWPVPMRDTQASIVIWQVLLIGVMGVALILGKLSTRRQWAASVLISVLAYRDALTGLPNRRAFNDRFKNVIERLRQQPGTRALLAVIDLDHFKRINDLAGHAQGDQVLSVIGAALGRVTRQKTDIVARTGGEEFALILYDVDENAAQVCLSQLLTRIQALELANPGSELGVVTCSIGGTLFDANSSFESSFHAADANLYAAKQAGRNTYRLSL